jgi:hypothetical protein
VSIHLSHRVVQNVERPRGALNPAMRDATDTRHHVCERRRAMQAARSGRLEGSHMRMERVAHDERARGRRQRRPAATPSSQDARRHCPPARVERPRHFAVCLLFSDSLRVVTNCSRQIFAEMAIYPRPTPPLPVTTGFSCGQCAGCQSSARNVHFVRRSRESLCTPLLFHSVINSHQRIKKRQKHTHAHTHSSLHAYASSCFSHARRDRATHSRSMPRWLPRAARPRACSAWARASSASRRSPHREDHCRAVCQPVCQPVQRGGADDARVLGESA